LTYGIEVTDGSSTTDMAIAKKLSLRMQQMPTKSTIVSAQTTPRFSGTMEKLSTNMEEKNGLSAASKKLNDPVISHNFNTIRRMTVIIKNPTIKTLNIWRVRSLITQMALLTTQRKMPLSMLNSPQVKPPKNLTGLQMKLDSQHTMLMMLLSNHGKPVKMLKIKKPSHSPLYLFTK
jgi:hypothetical protein